MPNVHNALARAIPLQLGILRALGQSESDLALERFGETLQPGIDLWSRPEWEFLREEFRCSAGTLVAAGGATTLASIALYNNPARAPNTILVLEEFWVSVTATAVVNGYMSASALSPTIATGIATRMFTDRRASLAAITNGNEAIGQVLSGIPVGTPTGWIQADNVRVLANETQAFRGMVPAVIPPGHFIAAPTMIAT